MPRYFFDYRDGDHLAADSEGTELPDLTSAQAEAVATLAELARDALPGSARSASRSWFGTSPAATGWN